MWEFNKSVSTIYDQHVRQHIPNYERIIELTVDIANDTVSKDSNICDFGSAKGYTLQRLYDNNFVNLYGVENSQAMRDSCNNESFTISEKLPEVKFDLIIANWSLHFNKNKLELLTQLYESLNQDSYLILSEKVSENEYSSKKYHEWKLKQNVSLEEIQRKQESLKGAMHINSIEWYLTTLKQVGFTHVEVIDSFWCFSTLLCKK